jgi:hypothetical protein
MRIQVSRGENHVTIQAKGSSKKLLREAEAIAQQLLNSYMGPDPEQQPFGFTPTPPPSHPAES